MGSGALSNCSFSCISFTLCLVALMAFSLPSVSSEETKADDSGCGGGTCPFPTNMAAPSARNTKNDGRSKEADVVGCGLWMGPSQIKEAEDHGFGLGIFTGKVSRYFIFNRASLFLSKCLLHLFTAIFLLHFEIMSNYF